MSHPRTAPRPADAALLVPLLGILFLLATGCGGAAGAEQPAGIASFETSSGVLQSGEPASASVRVENRGTDLMDHPGFELVRGNNITDEGVVDELASGADVLVHLAASVGVKLILEQPVCTI